jgi:hypothetical protein
MDAAMEPTKISRITILKKISFRKNVKFVRENLKNHSISSLVIYPRLIHPASMSATQI